MSRLFEALKRLEADDHEPAETSTGFAQAVEILNNAMQTQHEIEGARSTKIDASPKARLVALSAPRSLGAEKFRALATRLDNMRHQRELKSFQVTSSLVNEGKSLVAANLAVTLANYNKSRVLLVEGDLHKPTLSSLFGLGSVKGLGDWWSAKEQDLTRFLYQLGDMPLWFVSAGKAQDQPSDLLQSARFREVLSSIATQFDWIIVDSTPMLPIVDANLWSQLLDGTLLVVREGVATVNALKKGLESFDNPKLLGVVLNEASEFDQGNYAYSHYGYR
jgi:capsular exopolysaccharide synthesis family protein